MLLDTRIITECLAHYRNTEFMIELHKAGAYTFFVEFIIENIPAYAHGHTWDVENATCEYMEFLTETMAMDNLLDCSIPVEIVLNTLKALTESIRTDVWRKKSVVDTQYLSTRLLRVTIEHDQDLETMHET